MKRPSKSIAILPFRNLSGKEEDEYFSDGITEELLNLLSRVEGLQVTARTSAFSFKGQNLDAREIGQRLGVSHVLEGSVRNHARRIRVTTQLIDTNSGFLLDTSSFDREMENLFEIQDELASRITAQLRKRLALETLPERHPEIDPAAYNDFLKGNFSRNQGHPESVRKAMYLYEQVIRKSPDYAPAHAALSRCYTFLSLRSRVPVLEANAQSRKHALRAVELDPNLVEGQLALAIVSLYAWEWDRCRMAIQRAIALNPGNAEVHVTYARYLKYVGLNEQGIRELELALKLDPLSVATHNAMAEMQVAAGNYPAAIEVAKKALQLAPESRPAMYNLGWAYMENENYDRALEVFAKIEAIIGWTDRRTVSSGVTLGRMGHETEVRHLIQQLHEQARTTPGMSLATDLSSLYLSIGELDNAFYYLNKGIDEKQGMVPLVWTHSHWKAYRDHPEFRRLIGRTGLIAHIEGLKVDREKVAVTLRSDTRETLTLSLEDLMYAQAMDNYTRIVWRERDQLRRKTLRVTLKKLADQLEHPGIVRVHKSYLVNLRARPERRGNLRAMTLHFAGMEEGIPVSRTQARSIAGQLEEE